MSVDFGWFFKGKEINGLVQNHSRIYGLNGLDISKKESLDQRVNEIFGQYKHQLGTWFETSKKSAIRSALIEAKMKPIAAAAIYFYNNDQGIETEESIKELCRRHLTQGELEIINRNRKPIYGIFKKNKIINKFVKSENWFNPAASKFSSVSKHISKEFAKIGSAEKLAELNAKSQKEQEKQFEKKYQRYLINRTFNGLTPEEVRKCDERLVCDFKINRCCCPDNFETKEERQKAKEEWQKRLIIAQDIKIHAPDVWKQFTLKEQWLLESAFEEQRPLKSSLNKEFRRQFEEKYQKQYLKGTFGTLTREEIRKCDERLVCDFRKNFFLKEKEYGRSKLIIDSDGLWQNRLIRLKNIKDNAPDLWKKFSPKQQSILKREMNDRSISDDESYHSSDSGYGSNFDAAIV